MPGCGSHVRPSFGYVNITWKVKHFWLLSCSKNWEVNSPAFDVQTTRWQLLLRSISKDVSRRHLCAYLQRLPSDDGPYVVRVHWNVRLCNCTQRKTCCCQLLREKAQMFRRGDHRPGEVIENMECLSSDLKPFEADNLVIECKLVVDDPEMSSKKLWSDAIDEGLRSLSEDMDHLFQKGHFSDIVINVGGVDVPAIKAILHVRNKTLANIFNRDISATIVNFPADSQCLGDEKCPTSPAVNGDAVWNLVAYLHHGRLDEIVFGRPSVSVAECACILDVKEVRAHYVPDVLTLKSRLDVEKHVVAWFLPNFEEGKRRPIASPTLIHNSSVEGGPAWRLVLYPMGKYGSGKHVAIYAEASCGGDQGRSKVACLEFALVNCENKFLFYRRLQKPPGDSFESLGVDDFLKRPFEWDEETLQVRFRLRISDGAVKLSKFHHHVTSGGAPPDEEPEGVRRLSIDLDGLLFGNMIFDFIIRCSGGITFRVHRGIMAVRARSFSALAGSSNELGLEHLDVSANVVSVLLSYIYSGQLLPADEDIADELLLLAEYLGVDALARTCSRIVERDGARRVKRGRPSSQED